MKPSPIIYLEHILLYASSGLKLGYDGPPALRITQSLQPTGFITLLRHRTRLWALTPLFSPFPSTETLGGIVSVTLSLRLLLVAVSNCCALCCPDFPP